MKNLTKRLLGLSLALLLGLTLAIPAAATGNAVEAATNGVVSVYSEVELSNGEVFRGTGSAFGVGTPGEPTDIFVTNRHVVTAANDDGSLTQAQRVYLMLDQNALNVTYRAVEIDGELYTTDDLPHVFDANTSRMVACDVLYCSEDYDFAILQAVNPVEGRVALTLADSAETASVADAVYALGFPGVSDEVTTSTGWEFSGNYYDAYLNGRSVSLPIYTLSYGYNGSVSDVTLSSGAVSRFTTMASENDTRIIQHDAILNGGNSGGPLVDENGTVLGINTWGGNASEVLNYSIYIDYAMEALDELGIPYNTASGGGNTMLILVIVVVVLAAVILLAVRSKKKTPAPPVAVHAGAGAAPIPAPAPDPAPQGAIAGDIGLRLQGETGSFAGRRFALVGTVRLGRDPESCEIAYPANVKGISRAHCELILADGKLFLKDLGSTYGTFLGGGQRLAANQPVQLRPGDSFYLASTQETFVIKQKGGL